MKKIIYLATTNLGKFDEIRRYVDTHEPSIELRQFDQDLPELQTLDQKAIAISKAQEAWRLLHKPVLVDDSGFYFDHYHNFPGTLSKFIYKGIGFEGIFKLTEVDNRATGRLFMVYKEREEDFQVFEAICKGTIVRPPSLNPHAALPYYEVFQPAGATKTLAQLQGTQEESKYSQRLQALQQFLSWYKKIY